MKIVNVTPRYLPAELRGGEEYIRILSEHLSKKHNVTVMASNALDIFLGEKGIPIGEYVKQKSRIIRGVKVIYCPVAPFISVVFKVLELSLGSLTKSSTAYKVLSYFQVLGWGPWIPSIIPLINSTDYDVVHSAIYPTSSSIFAFVAAKLAKVPFFYTPFYHYKLPSFRYSQALSYIIKNSDVVIAVTNVERTELIKIGANSKKTFIVPLSIEISDSKLGNREEFRQKYGLEDKFIVLSHPWTLKGGSTVLLALKKLSKKVRNLALVTIGEPDRQYLSIFRKFSPFSFTILNLGWVYSKKKYDAFSACDVFAMPSISDAFGVVYLESWAWRKPVIGAKNTVAEDIIRDGQDGFLVDYGNIEQLAKKLLLLYNKSDLKDKMGDEGRARVEYEFTPQNTRKAFEYAMEKVL